MHASFRQYFTDVSAAEGQKKIRRPKTEKNIRVRDFVIRQFVKIFMEIKRFFIAWFFKY